VGCAQAPAVSPRPSTESDCGAGIGAAAGTVDGVGAASADGAIDDGRFFLGAPVVVADGLPACFAAVFGAPFLAGAEAVFAAAGAALD